MRQNSQPHPTFILSFEKLPNTAANQKHQNSEGNACCQDSGQAESDRSTFLIFRVRLGQQRHRNHQTKQYQAAPEERRQIANQNPGD